MGTLGWLGWRVYHRGGATFTVGAAPVLPPEAYFYAVRASGRQVGVASITVDTVPRGIRVTERLGLDIPLQASGTRSQYVADYILGPT